VREALRLRADGGGVTSHRVHEKWAERSGEYSPDYYAYYGPDDRSELLGETFDGVVPVDAPVLELGCSSGRHLAYLHEQGYERLHGIDVNPDSFDVMRDAYPDLAEAGTFHAAAMEEVVEGFADDAFAAVYSVQTLQHVPPENEWLFDELVRIAADRLVTVEVERERGGDAADGRGPRQDGGNGAGSQAARDGDDGPAVNYVREELPLYYRDWRAVFTGRGWEEVGAEPVDTDTFRLFRPSDR
jgi:SAM-dependent methyltransferase